MKKLGLLVVGIVAAIILLANVDSFVGMVIGLVIMYFSFKRYVKSYSTGRKVMWATVGVVAFAVTVSNFPAILAIVAAYVLYLVYKKWNETKVEDEWADRT